MQKPTLLTVDALRRAISSRAAAFRCRRRLQPAGGPGEKVFPPTYAESTYAIEERRVPGREAPVTCVVLDSVQSQANRMEQALQEAWEQGRARIPVICVDFSAVPHPGSPKRITSLQAPHRIADAILRDSEFQGVPFRESAMAQGVNQACAWNATPLLELCPTALVFGMWDTTGPHGALGARFERAMVSEIVGVGATLSDRHRNRGTRVDPLGASRSVPLVREGNGHWRVVEAGMSPKVRVRPSELNHGSVPFESANSGVTLEFAEQTSTLSLIALRRLRFPVAGRSPEGAWDEAAHTVLAALSLASAVLAFSSGLDLRSRCLLWPEEPMVWELLAEPGQPAGRWELKPSDALNLLHAAVDQARAVGLPWREEPVVLTPSMALLELVRRSHELPWRSASSTELS